MSDIDKKKASSLKLEFQPGIVENPDSTLSREQGKGKEPETITNFTIVSMGAYSEEDQSIVWLKLRSKKNTEQTIVFPYEDVRKRRALKHLPPGFVYYLSETTMNKVLSEIINLNLDGIEPLKFNSVKQGLHYDSVLKRHYFVLGNVMINVDKSMNLINNCGIQLRPRNHGYGYMDLLTRIANSPVFPPVLLLTVLSSFVKHLLEDGTEEQYGYTNYIFGPTGSGKTTIAKFYVDLFSGSENIASLSSEKKAIDQLNIFTDIPILVDDLNKSISSRVTNAQEAKLSMWIQHNQGAGNSMDKGINGKLNHVAYVTAEYVLNNYSTLNRCLLIKLNQSFDPAELSFFTENKARYLAFIYDFLEWVCQNYDELRTKAVNELAAWRSDYRKYDASKYEGLHRVLRTKHLLEITLSIFKLFLKEKLKLDTKMIDRFSTKLEASIDNCINDTLGYIDTSKCESGYDFIIPLINEVLYRPYYEIVTEKWNKYHKAMKTAAKSGTLPKFIFFYDGQCLCVKGDTLVAWLKQVNKLEVKPTKQAVSKQLHYHGLLKVVGGEYVSHINIPEKPKGDYYQIYLSRLEELDQNRQRKEYGKVITDFYDLPWVGDHRGSAQYGTWGDNTNDHDDDTHDNTDPVEEDGKYDDLDLALEENDELLRMPHCPLDRPSWLKKAEWRKTKPRDRKELKF